MSIHIKAAKGDIAETVLLPGDPLRAQYFAEQMLENPRCYNKVRGMYGFTGEYQGRRVSIQGTGMGIPSSGIYISELISEFGARQLIRVGTCGAIQADLPLGAVILAMSASSDTNINRLRFNGLDFAPTANFDLLLRAYQAAESLAISAHVSSIFTTDQFYHTDENYWKIWASFGILALEMETAGLYTLAAQHGVKALAILTVSDNIVTEKSATAEDREKSYREMFEIALSLAE